MKICNNKKKLNLGKKGDGCVKRQKMLSIASNKVWADNMKGADLGLSPQGTVEINRT